MSDARAFAADLLTGRRAYLDDHAPVRSGSGQSPDEVLADTRESLDLLEALRARDSNEALRVFREYLDDQRLTERDLVSFLEVWRQAIDQPAEFQRELREPVRGVDDWLDRLRAYLHRPAEPTEDDLRQLEAMASYRLPRHHLAPQVNPRERMLETLDPVWVPLLKVKLGERHWPKSLRTMPRHGAASSFVYSAVGHDGAELAAGRAHDIALFSDFGTGYYHSWGIAEQLTAWMFPYAFHLGDVYYAGRQLEFTERFQLPLFDVVAKTRLLGLAENHELYSGGQHYLDHFRALRAEGRSPQEGSYFCVRFPEHQVIGIDVNWQGRQRYQDVEMRSWLSARLAEADRRTTILLSGSAPFVHGEYGCRPLLDDLRDLLTDGAVGLWFWGDDHYCALFERVEPEVRFFGSCIGHGGFPGPRVPQPLGTYRTRPLWLEKEPRFPTRTKLRGDMTNHGWCQATLRPGGGVDLLYVDWLWCKRAAISFTRDGARLVRGEVTQFDRDDPVLHEPAVPDKG